jgi:rhodanese-related sulfurtransferase
LLKVETMTLPAITPQQAHDLAAKGAKLIDVREPREFAGEHIEGSVNLPLSAIAGQSIGKAGETVIFFCKSGARTNMAANQLERLTTGKALVMGGGLMAWKLQGLPTARPESSGQSGQGLFSRLFSGFGTGR